jgi:hypothetical protein
MISTNKQILKNAQRKDWTKKGLYAQKFKYLLQNNLSWDSSDELYESIKQCATKNKWSGNISQIKIHLDEFRLAFGR